MNNEITREQIEALRKLMISGTPDVEANPLNHVFTLALVGLSVQPMPIADLPPSRTDDNQYLFKNYDGTFSLRKSDKEWWLNLIKDDPSSYKGHIPQYVYNLSSLPTPKEPT